jgi:hypothetical protein
MTRRLATILFVTILIRGTAHAQQFAPPIFHGLKLGVPLSKQLPPCQWTPDQKHVIVHSTDALCAYHLLSHVTYGDEAPVFVYAEGALSQLIESHTPLMYAEYDSSLNLLLPTPTSKDEDATVESVHWSQSGSGYEGFQVEEVLATLKQKYGDPKCEHHSVNFPKELADETTNCTWTTAWGHINFEGGRAVFMTRDRIEVTAQTNRYLKFLSDQKRANDKKLKDIF